MENYTLLSVFVAMVFVLNLNFLEVDGRQSISIEEDLEYERQLKILNKPPIKTIHSSWGDIYDCIDFYKQPAFDHPLLKNHKFQMKPNSELKGGRSESGTPIFQTQVESCAQGTVPIRRTRKEDLIRAKYSSLSIEPMSAPKNEYFAGIVYQHDGETFHGATANISIWKPNVNLDEYSMAEISLRSGWDRQYNRIHVGWMVNPLFYGNDTNVRQFTYWTADNGQQTGCYNTLCPGFVQVDGRFTPDLPYEAISVYGGDVVEVQSHVYLDSSEKKWWYVIQGTKVGYWPTEIVPRLSDIGVERIYWGGHSKSNEDGHVPEMGSGQFPNENFRQAAYFTQMQYNDASGTLLDLNYKRTIDVIGCKEQYDMNYYGFLEEAGRRHSLQYGGPGGKC
ncbi:hypothetical protein C5167_024942 [Papaver somniferum]|uniref:Neprosin PEP catalytic domain-containing protein n=1 Tax=Papaver somniferum TaxID=3469 RepID=A0A4Y7JTC5_PAPSO|nr:uncharacterized protein LOC113280200 [Papaver somniferum]RZC63191.1 hypothetical protein C5167_024942 [Papaver somniferum]